MTNIKGSYQDARRDGGDYVENAAHRGEAVPSPLFGRKEYRSGQPMGSAFSPGRGAHNKSYGEQ